MNWDRGLTSVRPRFSEGRAPAYDRAVQRGTAAPVRYAGTRPGATGVAASARARSVGIREGVSAGTAPARSPSPRYINRGNQIIRSQTGQPIAPSRAEAAPGAMGRDTAAARTAPSDNRPGSSAPTRSRPAYAAPRYSAPSYNAPTYSAPGYSAPRGYERATPRAGNGAGGDATPRAQPYQRAAPPSQQQPRVYQPPQYQRPQYQPPQSQPRQYQAPQYQPPPNRGGAMRAPAYQPPSRGYERPTERAAPASRPSGGGERAVPRAGGGQAETRAPGGASRSHRGSR
jgi:hypothetical protein